VFWFSLQNYLKTVFIPRRTERGIIINLLRSSWKAHFILVKFHPNINFLDRFSKKLTYQISRKIRPKETELPHADGKKDRETDMTKLIVPFRNFVNASKNGREISTGKADQDVNWQIKWFGPFTSLLGTKIHIRHNIL
jgi:hypothetical protein